MNDLQSLSDTIGAGGFMPHGYCLSWSPGLLSLHVISDLLIVLAYYSIPITLTYFTWKRKDFPYPVLFWLFSLFIVACGTTHLLSAVTIWIPLYWLDGMVKAVTAVVSVAAAIMMIKVVPLALALRSPAQLEMEIKERKQAEFLLIKQKQFSEDVITSLPGIFYMLDTQGQFVQVNKQFLEVSGYSQSEFDSMNALDFFEGEDKNLIANKIRETFEVGDVTVEAKFVTKSGEKIPYTLTGHVTILDNQPYLIGIGTDITESKKKEFILRQSEEALKETQRIAHLGSWYLDLATNQVFWSEELYKMYGVDSALPPPLYTESMKLFTSESWEKLSNAIAQAAEKGIPYELELEMVPKRGGIGWMLARGEQVRDANGAPVRVRGVAMDITERKLAEIEISNLNKSLESKVVERTAKLEAINKDLESFSYSISHDLRSPLRAISGFSKILKEDYENKLDSEGNRLLNVVGDNAKKMGNLIDDILAFSRAGRDEVEHTAIDMKKMVEGVWEELKPGLGDREGHLDIRNILPASGDAPAIHQVVFNLLSNAIKFSKHQSPAHVEIDSYVDGSETVFYVKDNGVGFDMQYAPMLFGVFKRLHGMDEFEGTGIGLAIVKRIINKHGGRVWAEGKPNQGATFYFSLPTKEIGS